MPSALGGPPVILRSSQVTARRHLLAAVLGVLPLYSSLIIMQLRGDRSISVQGFALYLAVIAPAAIATALLLLRFLCGESPRQLNLRPGKPSSDLLAVVALSLVTIVASVISQPLLPKLLPESASNTSVANLMKALASDPGLFVVFVGPLVFLGAASEEVVRVYLLSRLWKAWSSNTAKLLAVVISSCLFGLIHLYQGSVSAAWTVVYGLIMALYYLRFGRVAPMVFSHYLTNALQFILFAALAR